jgi:pimeloyl-ACP methyl ester carboxylesterase
MAHAERAAAFQVDSVRPLDDAAKLRVPSLIVAGEVDAVAPPSDALAIARAAGAGARLLLVRGAGHGEVLERCGAACESAFVDLLARSGLAGAIAAPR